MRSPSSPHGKVLTWSIAVVHTRRIAVQNPHIVLNLNPNPLPVDPPLPLLHVAPIEASLPKTTFQLSEHLNPVDAAVPPARASPQLLHAIDPPPLHSARDLELHREGELSQDPLDRPPVTLATRRATDGGRGRGRSRRALTQLIGGRESRNRAGARGAAIGNRRSGIGVLSGEEDKGKIRKYESRTSGRRLPLLRGRSSRREVERGGR